MSGRNGARPESIQFSVDKNFRATLATDSRVTASQGQARDEQYRKEMKVRGDSIMTTAKNVRVARFVVAFGVAALSCGAASAQPVAQSDASTQTVVNYTDLDLSKDADVRSLYARLQHASARVCGEYNDLRSLSKKHSYDVCYQESLSRAVDAVNHSAVTAMFAADSRIKLAGRVAKVSANT
jgi:UrcA family protein